MTIQKNNDNMCQMFNSAREKRSYFTLDQTPVSRRRFVDTVRSVKHECVFVTVQGLK